MKHCKIYGVFLILIVSDFNYAASVIDRNSYWQCSSQDGTKKLWSAKNGFEKAALNQAFASCKKESDLPSTCKTSKSNCKLINHKINTNPIWYCTALDQIAETWQSIVYDRREDAALGAKAFCIAKSSVPDTCYINLISCVNLSEGDD